jgi:hypothetical protein
MGLLSRLLGNASEADVADVEADLERILAEDEKATPIQKTFRRGTAIFDVQQALATSCR